ncbi:MAG TPA: hypothetical protein VJ909_06595 [Prolixibacteraceae bacterium]|nr:hypothetical protein [Prolixibacteraceae bacterium]
MRVICIQNGQELPRDPFGLDLIECDVVEDYVRTIDYLETNPAAQVIIDVTGDEPAYQLENCSESFRTKFYELVDTKQLA